MVRDAPRAFREEDIGRAKAVISLDDRVDTINARVFRELLAHPGADEAARARSTSLILVAHSLERIADHATNICEVIYLVEGADIRHQAKPFSDTP